MYKWSLLGLANHNNLAWFTLSFIITEWSLPIMEVVLLSFFVVFCMVEVYCVALVLSISLVPPWLISLKKWKVCSDFFFFLFFFGPLWSSLSLHWWAQQSRSLKVPALSGMWRPARIQISDSRVILCEWKMESREVKAA